jgi:glycosyltransferase involved in cell wall biosynthesis
MGIRGIPAKYGGFETFAEGLATKLVERGHEVTVYGRSNMIGAEIRTYQGVKIRVLPTIRHKYLDTVAHTFLSVLHSLWNRFDMILICNAANSLFSFLPRMAGMKVVVNVDGIERLRKKWNWLGKSYYRLGEYLSTKLPNAIVTDAEVIRKYYLKTYKKDSLMIPYGTALERLDSHDILKKYDLEPGRYILFVSRLEPENNAHLVMEAFRKIKTDKKLAVVGDAPYATAYKKYLGKIAEGDRRIICTGFVFGQGYQELQSHAACYVQATEVGGTHPALLEAMACGNCVLANGTSENVEVVGDSGVIYQKNDIHELREKLAYLIGHEDVCRWYGQRARARVRERYSLEKMVDRYESFFLEITGEKAVVRI